MQAAFTALCADAQAKTRKAEDMIFGYFSDIEVDPTPTKMGTPYDGILYIYYGDIYMIVDIYVIYVIYVYIIYKYDVYIVDNVILGACDDGVYPR